MCDCRGDLRALSPTGSTIPANVVACYYRTEWKRQRRMVKEKKRREKKIKILVLRNVLLLLSSQYAFCFSTGCQRTT